ncbi:ATP/GTP-binding protein [Streptomyces xiamenensis]|uniref:ATP/GTP-binding protein n=1 Tax=Streptomyces xiamenensis TaxID=408015 RepID=UPI0035D7DBE5
MSAELHVARAELVLAKADHRPLREVELEPDPLGVIALAAAGANSAIGEQVDVVLDLLPISGAAVLRRRRRLLRRGSRKGPSLYGTPVPGGPGGASGWGAVRAGLTGGEASSGGGVLSSSVRAGLSGGPSGPASFGGARGGAYGRLAGRQDLQWEVGKYGPGETVFAFQLLIRAVATHPMRARALLQRVVAACDMWTGENWWRPVGPHRTAWKPYSNIWWRRSSFDRRFERGDFAPAAPPRRRWATADELVPLLKPPTTSARGSIARCGGVVPAAPPALPEYTGQPDVVPLGVVTGPDGQTRLAGVWAKDILFGAFFGKSGYGKTELGLVQFLARAYAGDGVWFLDPHGAAVSRALPYLTHPAVADRVWLVNLGNPRKDTRIATWNPLSMEGRQEEEVQSAVGAVVGAIASAQGWSENAPRARTILSNAVRTLAHLGLLMCQKKKPELQPTIFQIRTLLTDGIWREKILGPLPAEVQPFWHTAFPTYPPDAISTVTNAIDRLDASLSLRAFLGAPRSGYDVRRAMDDRRIVLMSPSGTGEADQMIASLLIFDLFRAGLSRQQLLDEGEKPATFWSWLDELTAIDGASNGYVAAILEQLRKYEVRMMAMTQMAMRLSEPTRYALMNNQSLLAGTGADHDEAVYVSKRLPGVTPETVMGVDRFEYVMSAVVQGRRTSPFRVRGVPVEKVYADYHNPKGLRDLQKRIDKSLERRTVGEITGELASLDKQIAQFVG